MKIQLQRMPPKVKTKCAVLTSLPNYALRWEDGTVEAAHFSGVKSEIIID